MKATREIIIAVLMFLSTIASAVAGGGNEPQGKSCSPVELTDHIREKTAFPELVSGHGYEGTVKVQFSVNNAYKVKILSIESDSDILALSVKEELNQMSLHPELTSDCGVYYATLEFKN